MTKEEFVAQIMAARSKLSKKSLHYLTYVVAKFASFTPLLLHVVSNMSAASPQFPLQIVAVLKRLVTALSSMEKVAPFEVASCDPRKNVELHMVHEHKTVSCSS